MEKDLRQACAVAKKIVTDEKLMKEVQALLKNMAASWKKKIKAAAQTLPEYISDCNVSLSAILSNSAEA